jgi:hypothetical protein
MIYDPRRRALELKDCILKSMTPKELAEYLASSEERASPAPDKIEEHENKRQTDTTIGD